MESYWPYLIIVVIAVILLIVFLVWRDQKDKDKYVKKLIDQDETAMPKEADTEVDTEVDIID